MLPGIYLIMKKTDSEYFTSVKAVIFDFDGTLDGNGLNWTDRIYQQFNAGGLYLDYVKVLQAAEKAKNMLHSDKNSRELNYTKTIEIFIYWIIRYMDIVIENYLDVLVQPFIESTRKTVSKIKVTLAKLAKIYPLAIISNSFGNCHGWCSELGIAEYFKFIIDSGLVEVRKPDLKIFALALKEFGLKAFECIYIGDNFNYDIVTSMQTGMKAVWINNQKIKDSKMGQMKKYHTVYNFKQIEELLL